MNRLAVQFLPVRTLLAILLLALLCSACSADDFIVPPAEAEGDVPLTATPQTPFEVPQLGCGPGGAVARVNTDSLRVREGPSIETRIIKLLSRDDKLMVTGVSPDEAWLQVRISDLNQDAWVFRNLTVLSCVSLQSAAASSNESAHAPTDRGTRFMAELSLQTLRKLREAPAGDGGILYRRVLYVAEEGEQEEADCDQACMAIEDSRLADGSWYLQYENRYTFDRAELKWEHLVPLYEAHLSGAWDWDESRRRSYGTGGTGPEVRALVSLDMLADRGYADPADWMPWGQAARCAYAMHWIEQKAFWQLTVDPFERELLEIVLRGCADSDLVAPPHQLRSAKSPFAEVAVELICDARGEQVTIINMGQDIIDLEGWHLHDEGNENRFNLPRWSLQPRDQVVLAFGGAAGDLLLSDFPVWNDYGDTVYLYDRELRPAAESTCSI